MPDSPEVWSDGSVVLDSVTGVSAAGHPTVWTDGSLVLDRVTGVSSSGAGFFAHKLRIAGVIVGGVMLIRFVLRVRFSLAGVSDLFLGLFNLFRELRCGMLFWLCSHPLLFI